MFTPHKIAIITDQNVGSLYPQYFEKWYPEVPKSVFAVAPGENSKSMEEAMRLWQCLLNEQFDKQCLH